MATAIKDRPTITKMKNFSSRNTVTEIKKRNKNQQFPPLTLCQWWQEWLDKKGNYIMKGYLLLAIKVVVWFEKLNDRIFFNIL